MKIPLLDLRAQHRTIKTDIEDAAQSIIDNQSFIMGAAVTDFERSVAEFCGTPHGVACASGTDALLLALKTLDLEPRDEVITSPFTFFATAGAIVNAGGRPVFVDIDPDTFNLDMSAVERAITERTRAVVPVHLFGQMAPMARLLDLCDGRDIVIVEDAAQAIGAKQLIAGEWRMAGSVGATGCFSFFPSKNLGCWGDGGMIVTADEVLAVRLARLRTHGGAKQYHHDEVGINSRLDALQAAILQTKLPHLARWNEGRADLAHRYNDMLADVPEIRCPVTADGNVHVFHQYTIRAQRRDELMAHLKERGIGCAIYYPKALHVQPCFDGLGYSLGKFPQSESATAEVLSLPVFPELSEEQQDAVVAGVKGFYS